MNVASLLRLEPFSFWGNVSKIIYFSNREIQIFLFANFFLHANIYKKFEVIPMKKRYISIMIVLFLLFLFFGNTSSENSLTEEAVLESYSTAIESGANLYDEAEMMTDAVDDYTADEPEIETNDSDTTDKSTLEAISDDIADTLTYEEEEFSESAETGENIYEKSVLVTLENTDIFIDSAIEHIFEGNVKRGKAGGYHYECIKDTAGKVIAGTEVSLNDLGVYKAQVEVDGIPKKSNKGYSTFFPKDMDPQEVVDAINEAYVNRVFVEGTSNTYRGSAENGLEIEMYLNENEKIISAFPKE